MKLNQFTRPSFASLLCLFSCFAVIGCGNSHEKNPASASSQSSNVSWVAGIDTANASYPNECTVIQGIISPAAQSGSPRDDKTVHYFTLAAWRFPGKPVTKQKMIVLRSVPSDSQYFDDFPAYSIIRMSVLLSTDGKRAAFDKILPPDESDEELLAYGKELRKPVIISTKTCGEIVLNREYDWFEGKATWNGKPVKLSFYKDDKGTIESALTTAESLWADQSKWKTEIEECAVKELLPLKNGNWLQENEKPLTKIEFIKRLDLESISFHEDGSFEFWYTDGDLFWGHNISVGGNVKDGAKYANING